MPQGTVLGPLLFLLYINDIVDNITSQVRLFADDCILYREINTSADVLALQKTHSKIGQSLGKRVLIVKRASWYQLHVNENKSSRNTSLAQHLC